MIRILPLILFVFISISVRGQFIEEAQQRALDTLQKLKPLFQSSADDSSFVVQYSEKPFRVYTFERGDQEEDIEEQLYSTPEGNVAGPFRGEGTTNYIFKVIKYEEFSLRSKANLIYLKSNNPDKTDTSQFGKLAKKYADAYAKGKNARELAEKDGIRLVIKDLKYFYESERDDHNKKQYHDLIISSEKNKTHIVNTEHGPAIIHITNSKEKVPFKVRLVAVVKKG